MTNFKAAFLVILALLLLPVTSVKVSAQSYPVNSIEVEGNKAGETSLILSVSGLVRGQRLSSTSIQEAIHHIYALGLFSDVRVDGELAGGGINLKIVVKEHPKLKALAIEGNKHIKNGDIKPKLTLLENQMASPNLIKKNLETIKGLYRQEGYNLAEVTDETKSLAEGEIQLIIKIKENEKVKIREIRFVGNVAFDEDDLRGEMKSKQSGFLRSGTFKQDEYDADKDKIIGYYHKKGYVDAAIAADSTSITPDGKGLIITIHINEGNRYYFGDVKMSGNEHFTTDFLKKQVKFKAGEVYNSEKYEESLTNLYTAYQDDGYIHVRIVDNVQTVDSTLGVGLEISEGVPAHINKVIIEGNTKTKEKVIRRELFSRPGDIFQRSVLMRSMRNVMLLNYFNPQNTTPDLKYLPNGDVDLVVKVEEKPTGQVQAGAGYSGTDKLVGTLSLGIPNFRGNGQNVSIDWAFGKSRNSISLSFTEPWLLDTPTLLGVDVFNVNRQLTFPTDYTESSRGGGFRLGRRLSWPDNYFRTSVRYTLEEVRNSEISSDYKAKYTARTDSYGLLAHENQWLTTSVAGITITRDSRDLSEFATSGGLLQLTSEYSGGILGGDWLYHKHVFEASRFVRLWWKVVLAAKMKLGVIDSPEGDNKIPNSERFAPGGTYQDGMIRGYDDGTVIPTRQITLKDTLGVSYTFTDYVRGRSELVYNLELQVPIVPQQIYGLLFADAGNSWLAGRLVKPFDLDKEDGLKKSVGAGFRVVIPGLGTLGFDFGYGYNRPDKAGWKPHFQVGATF